jgi:hypothetical protein
MKFLLSFLILFFSVFVLQAQKRTLDKDLKVELKLNSDKYKITIGKLVGWSAIALGSFVWYAKERFEFQGRRFFEIKFDVDEYGFWGSKSHIRVREKFLKTDFYHAANTGGKYVIISGAIVIGICGAQHNKKTKHYLIDFGVTVLTSIVFSYAGDRLFDLSR